MWSDPWVRAPTAPPPDAQESNFHFLQLRSFNWFYCQAVKKFPLYLTEVKAFSPNTPGLLLTGRTRIVEGPQVGSEISSWHWLRMAPQCIINLEVIPNQSRDMFHLLLISQMWLFMALIMMIMFMMIINFWAEVTWPWHWGKNPCYF